jgi:hypothetical protein
MKTSNSWFFYFEANANLLTYLQKNKKSSRAAAVFIGLTPTSWDHVSNPSYFFKIKNQAAKRLFSLD